MVPNWTPRGVHAANGRAAAGFYLIHLDTAEGKRSVKFVILSGR